jgi:hypothetical protein
MGGDDLVVGEGVEARLAVVRPNAAGSHTAKRQLFHAEYVFKIYDFYSETTL